jgi:hypothetical protein
MNHVQPLAFSWALGGEDSNYPGGSCATWRGRNGTLVVVASVLTAPAKVQRCRLHE